VPRLDRLWYEIDARTEKFTRGMGATVPVMSRFTTVLKAGPVAALGVFAVAAAGIAAVGIRSFAKFEDAMVKSLAIMGDVSESMRTDMAEAARKMARETTFSAEEAAKSFFFLASAGLDAEQSLAALPTVATFAQAGMFEMALATDLLTDAQSALGLTIRDDVTKNMQNMAKVSDVLVKANTIANATVQQFSESLTNKAGAAMKAFNIELEEGVAVLAAFADQGVKGQDAGTRFGIVLRDLTSKAIENESLFKRHKIAVFDSTGATANMGMVVQDLENALEGMSDETKKATLLQLGFSDRSQAALLSILGTSEAIMRYESQLRSATGITGVVARKNLESLVAQSKLLKSEFNDLFIIIGAKLAPIVADFLGGLSGIFFRLRGGLRDLELDTTATGVRALGQAVEAFSGAARTAKIDELREALQGMGEDTPLPDRLEALVDSLDMLTDGQRLIALGTLREELMALGVEVPPGLLRLINSLERMTDARAQQAVEALGEKLTELGSAFSRPFNVSSRDMEAASARFAKLSDQVLLSFISDGRKMLAAMDASTDEGIRSFRILDNELATAYQLAIKRGLKFAVDAANPFKALAEEAAKKLAEISTEELRVRVETGERSKQALLDRLRFELSQIREWSEGKAALILEVHQLELDLIEELNEKVEAQTALREKAFDMIATSTKSLVDNAELELRRFEMSLGDIDVDLFPELKAALDILRDAVETAKVMEPLNQELDGVKERLSEMATLGEPEIAALGATVAQVIAEAEQELKGDDLTEKRRTQINKLLKDALAIRRQLADMIGKGAAAEEQTAAAVAKTADQLRREQQQRMLNLAGTIESSVRGALDLANAFGLVNDETAEALQNVGQMAAGIARIAGGDIIGGGLSVLGGLANLVGGGPSPEQIRAQEVQRENTEAIDRLTAALGEFGLDITGTTFDTLRRGLQTFLAEDVGIGSGLLRNVIDMDDLERQLALTGSSMDELREVAQELGISFAGAILSTRELRQLMDAIAETELTRFRDTFQGTMQALQAEFDLFDITDPVEQLQRLVEVLGAAGTGSPIFARLLGQFDATDPESRNALDAFVREVFTAMQSGIDISQFQLDPGTLARLLEQFPSAAEFIDPLTGFIDAQALGGLTGQELLDALLQVEGLLDEIEGNTADAAGSTEQFAIQRSITEVTGSRIASLLSTTTHHLARIEEHTAIMAMALGGGFAPVMPPGLPLPGLGQQGGTIFRITVNLDNVREEEAPRVGELVANTIVDEIDTKLGLSLRLAQRSAGDATVTLN
jgi:TP901 family phage tail tape measure protein